MSTLRCTNLQDTSGGNSLTTAQIYNGAAKAWVNFNGTGTVAIRTSFNVSSITDRGAGQYAINFATALVDANYVLSGSAMYPTANSCHVITFGDYNGAVGTIPTASSCNMNTIYNLSSPQDCTYVTCVINR